MDKMLGEEKFLQEQGGSTAAVCRQKGLRVSCTISSGHPGGLASTDPRRVFVRRAVGHSYLKHFQVRLQK